METRSTHLPDSLFHPRSFSHVSFFLLSTTVTSQPMRLCASWGGESTQRFVCLCVCVRVSMGMNGRSLKNSTIHAHVHSLLHFLLSPPPPLPPTLVSYMYMYVRHPLGCCRVFSVLKHTPANVNFFCTPRVSFVALSLSLSLSVCLCLYQLSLTFVCVRVFAFPGLLHASSHPTHRVHAFKFHFPLSLV